MNIKKASDEELWHQWGKFVSDAAQIKREIDRRQNQPVLRVVKNTKLKNFPPKHPTN